MTARRRWRGFSKAQRDGVLFLFGLVGVGTEAMFHHDSPSTTLLIVYSGMLFSVPLLRINEWLNQRGTGKPE